MDGCIKKFRILQHEIHQDGYTNGNETSGFSRWKKPPEKAPSSLSHTIAPFALPV
jgi:hypothetical protein